MANNVEIINGSFRLSAGQRVVNNETISTASRIVNSRGGREGHIIEIRAKFPNGHCLKSWVWFDFYNNYIDFVGFQEFNPNLIRSGLNFGEPFKFSGFSSTITHDFTNFFNVFTMEWTKDYIYWKLNGKQYHKESINRYFEYKNGMNYNKIREPFDSEYLITFEVRCDPIDDRRVDKNSWTNPYLFIDYIKIYYSSDSETDESIQNKTENLRNKTENLRNETENFRNKTENLRNETENFRNKTEIAENGSKLNDSVVIKYVIIGFLVLFLMSIVFFCFVLYFIKKVTSIKKSIDSANNNDSETTKGDDIRESFDLYDDNEHRYYEIVESRI